MYYVDLFSLTAQLGNVKVAEMLQVDHATVWRWVTSKKDVLIEMQDGQPVAILHRHPIRN